MNRKKKNNKHFECLSIYLSKSLMVFILSQFFLLPFLPIHQQSYYSQSLAYRHYFLCFCFILIFCLSFSFDTKISAIFSIHTSFGLPVHILNTHPTTIFFLILFFFFHLLFGITALFHARMSSKIACTTLIQQSLLYEISSNLVFVFQCNVMGNKNMLQDMKTSSMFLLCKKTIK